MPNRRRVASAADPESSPLVRAAGRLMRRIESLEQEVDRLRGENALLRADVRTAVALFNQPSTTRGAAAPVDGRRRRSAATPSHGGQRRRRRKAAKGRATPASVTPAVVLAVLGKLGPSTASEIAGEITNAGTPVSGRAVRFLAERAGAQAVVGEDGKRRYRP